MAPRATVTTEPIPDTEEGPLNVGDIVTIHELYRRRQDVGRLFVVSGKTSQGNYTVEPTLGGRGVSAPRYSLVKADDAATAKGKRELEASASVPDLTLGTVVRFKPAAKVPDGAFVVIKTNDGTFNLAKVGGDDGRFYRSVDPRRLDVIDVSEIVQRWT